MSEDKVERLIDDLRHEADTSHFMDLAAPAIARGARPSPFRRLRTRAATVAASITLAFGGLGGVAYAANDAAPGDLLYGLDMALESIGIGNGGDQERLEEIRTLMDDGEIGAALQHAADHFAEDANAETALQDAVQRVSKTAAPEGVTELLTYLSNNIDSVDGPTVAELARSIEPAEQGPAEETPGDADNSEGPPEETPGTADNSEAPPEDTPGTADDPSEGPPEDTPGNADNSEGPPEETPGSTDSIPARP